MLETTGRWGYGEAEEMADEMWACYDPKNESELGEANGNRELRNTAQRLEVLKETWADDPELNQVLGKLLDIALGRYRQRLERYERDLREFESRYGADIR